MSNMKERARNVDGKLVHKLGAETIQIEPWGTDGLRVRVTTGAEILDRTDLARLHAGQPPMVAVEGVVRPSDRDQRLELFELVGADGGAVSALESLLL